MKRKPKNFRLVYGSGVSGEFADPHTGIAFYRMNWAAFRAAMQRLAESANDTLTVINTSNDDSLTVTPEGLWS